MQKIRKIEFLIKNFDHNSKFRLPMSIKVFRQTTEFAFIELVSKLAVTLPLFYIVLYLLQVLYVTLLQVLIPNTSSPSEPKSLATPLPIIDFISYQCEN